MDFSGIEIQSGAENKNRLINRSTTPDRK